MERIALLSDGLVALRAGGRDDVPALSRLRNDARLQGQLMARARPGSAARVERWLADKADREDLLFFVVADAATDAAAGYLQYSGIGAADGIVELGICLAPAFRGTGHAGAALALAERHLRDAFAVRKVQLRVFADNARARAFFARHGFDDCGLMRAHVWRDGAWRDVALMERLLEADAGGGAEPTP